MVARFAVYSTLTMRRLPSHRTVVWILVFTGLLLVTGATATVYLRRQTAKSAAHFEISLWYWHRPFRVPPQEASTLRSMGVRQLFVNAATITRDSAGFPVATLPQTWTSAPPDAPSIQLVFRVDDTVSHRLSDLPARLCTNSLLSAIQSQRRSAEQAGWHVNGVQIDMDAPTRLLPAYAALLRSLRPALAATAGRPALQLSITVLSSWYASRKIDELLDAVDFAAPQFYEEVTPRTRAAFVPISNQASLEHGLRAAERSGHPFYAGLPAYGHALVYDGHGNLRGLFHDAGAPAILLSPDFRLIRSFATDSWGNAATDASTAVGEQVLEFGGAHADSGDFRLLFDLPTPLVVELGLHCVRARRAANCRGVILYRYPAPGDADALPLTTLAALVNGQTPTAPRLKVSLRAQHAPLSPALDPRRTVDLFVNVTGQGPFGTRVGPDAASVTVHFDRAGSAIEASPGDFDTAIPLCLGSRSSLARADSLRFSTGYLAPGRTVTAGPIQISDSSTATIHVDWTSHAPEPDSIAHGATVLTLHKGNANR
jgi:Protein of unknown function (DUF3142)